MYLCHHAGAKKPPANDVMFDDDDDDMLGNMGLDGRKSTLLLPSDSPPQTGARSVLNNLLQGSKSEKKSEKPNDFGSSSLKMPGLYNLQLISLLASCLINSRALLARP